eukprot:scaffold3946_cov118-Isochrysis_galbana.AAC.2
MGDAREYPEIRAVQVAAGKAFKCLLRPEVLPSSVRVQQVERGNLLRRTAIGKNLSASQKIAVEFSKSQTNIAVEFPVREVAISDELHNDAQSNLNDLSRKKMRRSQIG